MRRTFPELIDQRNYVQHALMSLESGRHLDGRGGGAFQYESCRLASTVYSFLVIFPVPPVVGPFEILTQQLSRELETIEHDGLPPARLNLHIWALFMGAIGSIGLPSHGWFLSKVKTLLQKTDIREWKDLQMVLRSFLWHPSTNDVDGFNIWTETQYEETPVEDQTQLKSFARYA